MERRGRHPFLLRFVHRRRQVPGHPAIVAVVVRLLLRLVVGVRVLVVVVVVIVSSPVMVMLARCRRFQAEFRVAGGPADTMVRAVGKAGG